ncbi:RHNO1 protein, partial [Anseranas semipalmata]|nr:RHNO1 protein [Anseranas semipalmata]
MPPKKCTRKSRKAELVFLEKPWEGPIHCHEAPLSLAENPRHVPTKSVDQNTSAAWVCPQFETTKSVVLKAFQKKHRGPCSPQNQDANHGLLRAGGACQRAVPCKFLPLTFENSEACAAHSSDALNHTGNNTPRSHSQRKMGTLGKTNIEVNSSENCEETPSLPVPKPVQQKVFSPPDIGTPQPSVRSWRCSSALPQNSSHAWQPEKELASGIDPCERGGSAALLVTDTPEHEYGVKVTWRQRPHLLKYLRDR